MFIHNWQKLVFAIGFSVALASPGFSQQEKRRAKRPKAKVKRSDHVLDHKRAYDNKRIKVRNVEEHIDIKVTPPYSRHGKPGLILVEVYNNSGHDLGAVQFNLTIESDAWEDLSMKVEVDGMTPRFSALREIRIPGKEKLPKLKRVKISNLQVYNTNADIVRINHNVDLVNR